MGIGVAAGSNRPRARFIGGAAVCGASAAIGTYLKRIHEWVTGASFEHEDQQEHEDDWS